MATKKQACSQAKNRNNKGQFKKGISGNPGGRPLNKWRDELETAITSVQKQKRKKLMKHAVLKAYENDNVLISLLKKLLPDLRNVEGDISHTVTLAQAIKDVFRR